MAATTTSTFPGLLTNSRAFPRTTTPTTTTRPPSPSTSATILAREKRKVEDRKKGQLRALERL